MTELSSARSPRRTVQEGKFGQRRKESQCTIGGLVGGGDGEAPAILGEEIQVALVGDDGVSADRSSGEGQAVASPVLRQCRRETPSSDQRLSRVPVHLRLSLSTTAKLPFSGERKRREVRSRLWERERERES